MEQNQLIDELIAIWCNFTLEDIEKQFPDWNLFSGMKQGDIAAWAFVIYNVMTSRYWRHYCKNRFLSNDNEISVYAPYKGSFRWWNIYKRICGFFN